MDPPLDYYVDLRYTYSSFPNDSIYYDNVSEEISSRNTTDYRREKSIVDDVVITIPMLVICVFGAVGNGMVIWLLGFRVKRNPFSTYILNLAIADLGVLLSVTFIAVDLWIAFVYDFPFMFPVVLFLFLSMYSASQFLLTAIGIDRCVAVFFPLWHRCHRPRHLSTVVCAGIWFLSFLLTAITYTLMFLRFHETKIDKYYQFMVNALLCLPVMTITTAALFIKVCLKARQHRRGKLLTIILLTLLFFLLFAFPLNVIVILTIFNYLPLYASRSATLLACLNSSVNPAIYILVGRRWKSRQREDMKMVFQKNASPKWRTKIMRGSIYGLLEFVEGQHKGLMKYVKNKRCRDKSRPKLSIMTNISLTTLSIMDAALDHYDNPNYTYSSFPNDSIDYEDVLDNIGIDISVWVICIFGAVGNGIVIWLLGFRIKRNPFSTYILNLAIADLGVLLSVPFIVAHMWTAFNYYYFYEKKITYLAFLFLFLSTYSTSQFLLTAISIDRCVAVFFPLWHRCHRPPHLSTIVCALIWFLSFLFSTITYTIVFLYLNRTIRTEEYYQFIVNGLLCLPVMTIATGALFIKVCFKAQQHRRGKLLTIILLTLLFFLLFAFPLNVKYIVDVFTDLPVYITRGAIILACLNSSVNPAIYILVGRRWKSRKRESMKMIFQKVFKEEEICTEGVEIQL
ncbi:UNVERIFIED_CONTAM: hypothetical protein K2H54_013426 [Gekko kuhli]